VRAAEPCYGLDLNQLFTMSRPFSRRALIKGAAASSLSGLLPARAIAQPREVDVAIVGAGAAGIAAARRLAAQGRSHIVLEALPRVGGRVAMVSSPFGTPVDLGAHRLFAAKNPLVELARGIKFELYQPLASRRLYLGPREARDSEYDDFTATVRRAARAIAAVGETGRDAPAADVLPELGAWQETASFVLGPMVYGAELERISTIDFSRAAERSEEFAARAGLASLVYAASRNIPIELGVAVRALQVLARRAVAVETTKGSLQASAVIVTASPGVLASGRIRISPSLPERAASAIARLPMGIHNRVAFELPGNPLRMKDDETVLFRAQGGKTMRLTMRVAGSDIAYADLGGALARELADAGDQEMLAFVREMLRAHFSPELARQITWSSIARWNKDEWFMGSHAVVQPGFAGSRRALMEPVHERIFLAGEALHDMQFGTLAGAWASGERAANAALRVLPPRK
jgi:monoamine oxidase